MSEPEIDPWLKLAEVGRRLGDSSDTVRKLIKKGFLKSYVDPSTGWKKVRQSELQRYMKSFAEFEPDS